jgi:hypothetical protein
MNCDGIRILQPPQYAGHWEIGGPHGMRVQMTARPRWLTRLLMAWLVEWRWRDG